MSIDKVEISLELWEKIKTFLELGEELSRIVPLVDKAYKYSVESKDIKFEIERLNKEN